MAVIDFHSHILPGIDDGSKNVEMSMQMLEMSMKQGVDIMLATPHFYASRHRVETFLERRERAYAALKEVKKDFGPSLILGAEVAFFSGISQAEQLEELTIGESNIILLEMPFEPWTEREIREVKDILLKRKKKVVLAHLERYLGFPGNKKYIEELLELPLYVQINAESLLNWRSRRPLLKMFRNGQAHLLGSDTHRIDKRIPNLGEGRAVLEKKIGKEFLNIMDERGSRLLLPGGIDV